jgi:Tol biopolymer transport system component/DNA-binding winged helix-turn-helix (wHTH) protein
MQGDFRVGDRLVSPTLNRLVRDRQEVRIEPKAMQVLVYLAGRPNELASRDELIAGVWRDTFVTDDVLKRCISDLRKALGDNREKPEFIETIPKGGYRLIAPVSVDTGRAEAGSESGSRRWRQVRGWPLAAFGVLVVAVLMPVAISRWRAPGTQALPVLPLSTLPGSEIEPAMSPDGTRVAFTMNFNQTPMTSSLYVLTLGASSPLRIPFGRGDCLSPAWSPDGSRLAFMRHDATISYHEIVIVPVAGGTERIVGKVLSQGHGIDWSPDERFLVVNDTKAPGQPDGLYLFSLEDGSKRHLVTPPQGYESDSWPRFSPDGKSLAFIRQKGSPSESVEDYNIADLYILDLQTLNARRLTHDNVTMAGVDWMPDGRHLVFASTRGFGGRHLWIIPASGGTPQLFEAGLGIAEHPSIARHGKTRIVWALAPMDASIWRVPGPLGDPNTPAVRVDQSTAKDFYAQFSPDGRQIAFVSTRSGVHELWIVDADGSNLRQLTFMKRPMTIGAGWSPDGQWLTFAAVANGNFNIHIVQAAGGFPRQVTNEADDHLSPSFARDGRSIYFYSRRTGRDEVWKVPVSGGPSVQITRNGGVEAIESPDGRFLYYTKRKGWDWSPIGLWRIRLPDGEEEKIASGVHTMGWAMFKGGVAYLNFDAKPRTLDFFEFATERTRSFMKFERPPAWTGLSMSPDGRWILHGRLETTGADLFMLEDFK